MTRLIEWGQVCVCVIYSSQKKLRTPSALLQVPVEEEPGTVWRHQGHRVEHGNAKPATTCVQSDWDSRLGAMRYRIRKQPRLFF
jgi:hypothetical protein